MYGIPMQVIGECDEELCIASNSDIERAGESIRITRNGQQCTVAWAVRHEPNQSAGTVSMTCYELQIAFGLQLTPLAGSSEFVRRYGGSSGLPGKYHRSGRHLAIPGPMNRPGVGGVSILITPEIETAVLTLTS